MTFRLATLQDIELVTSLRMQMLQEVAADIPPALSAAIADYLKTHLADNTCICALGMVDGTVVAKAMLCTYDVMPDEVNASGKSARLYSVYTLPAYRGKGYMEKLLVSLLEEAKIKGIAEVFASAEIKAMPLYKRIGFISTETEMHIQVQ